MCGYAHTYRYIHIYIHTYSYIDIQTYIVDLLSESSVVRSAVLRWRVFTRGAEAEVEFGTQSLSV